MKETFVALLALCLCLVGCVTLNDVGRHLWNADSNERQHVNKEKKPIVTSTVVPNTPDAVAVIEAAIREAVGKSAGELTKSDLEKVKHLRFSGDKLPDVSSLGRLSNLESLYLSSRGDHSNPDLTFSKIADLQKTLPNCRITHNAKRTVNESREFIELKIREAAKIPTGDLSISDYNKITLIDLRASCLSDAKPLAKLNNLVVLHIFWNHLANISFLAELKQLEELSLGSNFFIDTTPLAKLTALKRLDLYNNQLTDINALSNLTQLWFLRLDLNHLKDISALSRLNKLKLLRLQHNQLADLTPLKGLTNLKTLSLEDNQFVDVTSLEGLIKLEDISLSNNQISNISPLSKLIHLESLYLSNNQITKISSLAVLKRLKVLDLRNNPDLTKAQVAELQKALPKCRIDSNPNK